MNCIRAMLVASVLFSFQAVAVADDAPTGASSCSGCHASAQGIDTTVPRLTGRSADDIVKAMADFRTGARPATVMDRLAKGYTDDEIKAIARWYAMQKD